MPPAIDTESVPQQWQAQFADLEDPRGRQGVEHPFLSIVMIAILALLALTLRARFTYLITL